MARRKKRTVRTSSRRSFKTAPKRRRSSSSAGFNLKSTVTTAGTGALYGVVRNKAGQLLSPVTQQMANIPVIGAYADNVALIGLSHVVGKQMPKLRNISKTAIAIEGYKIGSKIAGGVSSTSSANVGAPVYG